MLRTAVSSQSYDVTITIAGETTAMKFRALTLMERLALIDKITSAQITTPDIQQITADLDDIIISIEGYDEKPSEVLRRLEHKNDLDELLTAVYRWCHLSEQISKNLDSSPEQSTPIPESTGSVAKTVGVVSEPASTSESDSM